VCTPEQLLAPGSRVRFGEHDPGVEPADQQIVDVVLVDYVRVQRRRTGAEHGGDPADGQRVIPLGGDDFQGGVGDPSDGDRLLARCRRGELRRGWAWRAERRWRGSAVMPITVT